MVNGVCDFAVSGFTSRAASGPTPIHYLPFTPSVSLPEVRAEEVEQREEENPDDVYEVPVEPEVLHGRVVLGRVAPVPGPPHDGRDYPDADYHVQRVQARHREVEPEEHLRVLRRDARLRPVVNQIRVRVEEARDGDEPVHLLLVVLVSLHAEEDQAEEDRRGHEADLDFSRPARLRGPD